MQMKTESNFRICLPKLNLKLHKYKIIYVLADQTIYL